MADCEGPQSEVGKHFDFEVGDVGAVGGTEFELWKAANFCVPFDASTDPLTWVSWARFRRGGRCLLFNGPYAHKYVAHREAMPLAKTVGVAHSSYRPIPILRPVVL